MAPWNGPNNGLEMKVDNIITYCMTVPARPPFVACIARLTSDFLNSSFSQPSSCAAVMSEPSDWLVTLHPPAHCSQSRQLVTNIYHLSLPH